ncbi:unnamed protein product [Agarophyton chilense]
MRASDAPPGPEGEQQQEEGEQCEWEQQQQQQQQQDAPQDTQSYEQYRALFEEDGNQLWDTTDVAKALQPLTEQEKHRLRTKLPTKLANFIIRRADAAVRLRNTKPGDSSIVGKLLTDLPPDRVAWDDPENAEFRDYVYETITGPPSFRRPGSSLFNGGDGLPDMDDLPDAGELIDHATGRPVTKKLMSMFVGNVNSVDEQAAKVGYTLLALFVLLIGAKIVFALVSFFLSFTFSFLAIFALSAGIFVVFYLFRF